MCDRWPRQSFVIWRPVLQIWNSKTFAWCLFSANSLRDSKLPPVGNHLSSRTYARCFDFANGRREIGSWNVGSCMPSVTELLDQMSAIMDDDWKFSREKYHTGLLLNRFQVLGIMGAFHSSKKEKLKSQNEAKKYFAGKIYSNFAEGNLGIIVFIQFRLLFRALKCEIRAKSCGKEKYAYAGYLFLWALDFWTIIRFVRSSFFADIFIILCVWVACRCELNLVRMANPGLVNLRMGNWACTRSRCRHYLPSSRSLPWWWRIISVCPKRAFSFL